MVATVETSPEPITPVSLAQVMQTIEDEAVHGNGSHISPLPTGFSPLDEVINGPVIKSMI